MSTLSPAYLVMLPLLGCAVGTLGTLVGLGGGFLLVPVLILMFPTADPATIAFISLSVVVLNAASGTVGNIRAKRIDAKTAALLMAGAIPAAIGGATVARLVSRQQFEAAFGAMLLLGGGYILWRAMHAMRDQAPLHEPNRFIAERRGPMYRFYVNGLMAAVISPAAGFVSSFFGIGGGILQVPAMAFILRMPLRVASATSLLVLVPTALTGIATHIATGQIHEGWRRAGLLGLGALVGAQLGVYFAGRVNPRAVLIVLGFALFIAGARQLAAGLT